MAPKTPNPDLSIVIVNWNVSDLLKQCLASIARYTNKLSYEVIVVDNNSSDDSVEMVKRDFPGVRLISSPENLGFARGNNLALKLATGRHIGYLNPDIELIEDALGSLVDYLDNHPRVGVVAPKLLNTDRTLQNSIGRFTRLGNLINEYVWRAKAEQQSILHPQVETVVEVALGALLVVRGDVCREIGGFDERYFMYHEETDLCLTLLNRGLTTVYLPKVAAIHHGSKSSTVDSTARQRTLHENRKSQYLFFRKHYGFWSAQLAKLIIWLAIGLRVVIIGLSSFIRPNEAVRIKLAYYRATLKWLLVNW